MELHQETISFLAFVCIGAFYGVVFDFFRAMRKTKKSNDLIVSIQDISYFLIVGIILIIAMNTFMTDGIRIYNILSIALGILIYVGVIGNKIMILFSKLLGMVDKIVEFIFTPLDIFRQIFSKQIKFFKNIVIKCCKRVFYVINSNYVNLKQKKSKLITKEGYVCQEQVMFKKVKRKRKS